MYTFSEYVNLRENETSGLINIRQIPKEGGNTGPPVFHRSDTGLERLFDFLSKVALSFPASAIRAIVNFATTLKEMGFTGKPNAVKAAIGLGKLVIPPIVYTAAKLGGLAVPELVALLASPQFWEAYSRIGQMRSQAKFGPMFKEYGTNTAAY
jgi:hypothetical protein